MAITHQAKPVVVHLGDLVTHCIWELTKVGLFTFADFGRDVTGENGPSIRAALGAGL